MAVLRDRLMVGHGPLKAGILVRIQAPLPFDFAHFTRFAHGYSSSASLTAIAVRLRKYALVCILMRS